MSVAPMPPVIGGRIYPLAIAHAITRCSQAGADHHVPLFRAAGAGRIAFTPVIDRASFPNLRKLEKIALPGIVLLCDDDEAPTGPKPWACLDRTLRWASAAIVHSTGGEQHHYELAVGMAMEFRRLVVIDTCTAHADAWLDRCRGADVATLHISTAGDGIHPVPMRWEAVN